MARLTISIETDQEFMPATRLEQTREQFRLRDSLVIVVSALVNRGLTDGTIDGTPGVRGTWCYAAKRQKTTAKPDLPPAA